MKSTTCTSAASLLAVVVCNNSALAFGPPQHHLCSPLSVRTRLSESSVAVPGNDDSSTTVTAASNALTKQQQRTQQIRKEGGLLVFNTKFGALNPFAIYYGLVSIGLGLVWFVALTFCQFFYELTGGRFDEKRRLPVFCSQVWGTLLMLFTGCFPQIENWDAIREFHKK